MQKILNERSKRLLRKYMKEVAFMLALAAFVIGGIRLLLPIIMIKKFGYAQEDVTTIILVGIGVFIVLEFGVYVLVQVYKQKKK